jgi:hypothetical protein
MTHAQGPQDAAKAAMKVPEKTAVKIGLVPLVATWQIPTRKREVHWTVAPQSNSFRRPIRSTRYKPGKVKRQLTPPMIIATMKPSPNPAELKNMAPK